MVSPCLCTNLRLATRKVSAIYDAALEPLGINIAQYSLLRVIGDHQPVSLTELARLAELERSTIGRNVRVLQRMGFVQAGRCETDQREALVLLTEAGQALMRQALPLWEACQRDLVSRLGSGTVGALGDLLGAV